MKYYQGTSPGLQNRNRNRRLGVIKKYAGTECIPVDVHFDDGTIDNQTTELTVGL